MYFLKRLAGVFSGIFIFWIVCLPALWSQHIAFKKTSEAVDKISSHAAYKKAHFYIQASDTNAVTALFKSIQVKSYTSFNKQKLSVVSGIDFKQLQTLKENPNIVAIDVANRKAIPELIVKSMNMQVNAIDAAHAAYPALDGTGITVSIRENPFDATDFNFKGRVKYNSIFQSPFTDHATTMATLAAGAGNNGPFSMGVAHQSTLTAASFASLLPDNNDTLVKLGVTIQNHSYGVGYENYYGIESAAYDAQVNALPQLLHVFSAGNAGAQIPTTGNAYAGVGAVANLTGQFKLSKNTIAVGEVDVDGKVIAISSKGPASDGRIKPELVAFGSGGTSEAAALVSGAGAIVQQALKQNYPNLNFKTDLVKAILLNTANDVGRPGIDFETGYGSLNVLGAIQNVVNNRFWVDSVQQGQTISKNIAIPAGVSEIKITLVWNDLPGPTAGGPVLVNDLDMLLTDAGNTQNWLPWALSTFPHIDSLRKPAVRKTDNINNTEQISIVNPNVGTYTLKISGTKITGTQSFAVAYQLDIGLPVFSFPVKNQSLVPSSNIKIRWNGKLATTTSLYYRTNTNATWSLLTDTLFNSNNYNFSVPQNCSSIQFQLSASGNTTQSDWVAVVPPIQLKVGYNCATETRLFWNAIPGATQYTVNTIGATAPTLFASVTDTFIVIPKTNNPYLYQVVPTIPGFTVTPSYTIDYRAQGVDCYFKQIAALHPVTDSLPTLQVVMGTTAGITQIQLFKLQQNNFVPWGTLPSVSDSFYLSDFNPDDVANVYRVRLNTINLGYVWSDTITVLYTKAGQTRLFPNPVVVGQTVQVLSGPDNGAIYEIYDLNGRRIFGKSDQGSVKEIPTTGLQSGLYFVVTTDGSGRRSARKLIVR